MVQPPPLVATSNAESTETISWDDAIQQLYELVHKIALPRIRTAKVATIKVEDLHLVHKLITSTCASRQDHHEDSHLKGINRQLEAITAHLAIPGTAPTPQEHSYTSALAAGACGPPSDITPPFTRPHLPLPLPHPSKHYNFMLSWKPRNSRIFAGMSNQDIRQRIIWALQDANIWLEEGRSSPDSNGKILVDWSTPRLRAVGRHCSGDIWVASVMVHSWTLHVPPKPHL